MRIKQAALLLAGWLSFLSERPAAAASLAELPEPILKQSLAKALGNAEYQVVEARGFRLEQAGDVSGVVLGRYRERGTLWTFPVLGVLYRCEDRVCVSLLRLGQAARALAPIALIDLEQPLGLVGSLQPNWVVPQLREPTQRARWPALLIASDHQLQQPSGNEGAVTGHDGARPIEHALYLVSLRKPSAPTLLHTHTLIERAPEPDTRPAGPSAMRIGSRIEGLGIGRQGQDLLLQIIERDIDSRFSECLRPGPTERRYRLTDDHFIELANAGSAKPARGNCQ